MDIFIRRLPESVTRLDLIHFVADALPSHWSLFSHASEHAPVDCEIMQLTDCDTQLTEYHGIAHFANPTEALAVIGRLDGRTLKGKPMQVRKYFHRSELRDRRKLSDQQLPAEETVERRRSDRRRSELAMAALHAGATRAAIHGQQIHA